jgi:hypothetical protein
VDEHADKIGAQPKMPMHADLKPDNVMIEGQGDYTGVIDLNSVNVLPAAGLFSEMFVDKAPLVQSFTDAWNGLSDQKVEPRDVGLHTIVTSIDFWTRVIGGHKQTCKNFALAALENMDRYYPAPVSSAVPANAPVSGP